MAIDWMRDPFHTTFLGIPMKQLWSDFALWERLFNEYKLCSMIEIGTGAGGLSTYFHLQAQQRRFVFWTYDVEEPQALGTIHGESLRRCFTRESVWTPQFASLISIAPKPLMLYCDGGHKSREMQTFVPLLKHGDYAACHDWPGEISEKDIEPIKGLVTPIWKQECEDLQSWTRFFST